MTGIGRRDGQVKLRRRWGELAGALLTAAVSAGAVVDGVHHLATVWSAISWVAGGIVLAGSVAVLIRRSVPFRFNIGPHGLTLRVPGIDRPWPRSSPRLVTWTEIDALVLDQPPLEPDAHSDRDGARLVLVPSAWSELAAQTPGQLMPDGRSGVVVLQLDEVGQSREEIAEALQTFGDGCFIDVLSQRQERVRAHTFTVVSDGYDTVRVDELVQEAVEALDGGRRLARLVAITMLEKPSIRVAARGYDREQVHRAFEAIAAELGEPTPQ